MEVSDETLVLWMSMVRSEAARRRLNLEAVLIHAGSVINGQPIPLLVRVLTKAGSLAPIDLAKVETLMDGLCRRA